MDGHGATEPFPGGSQPLRTGSDSFSGMGLSDADEFLSDFNVSSPASWARRLLN